MSFRRNWKLRLTQCQISSSLILTILGANWSRPFQVRTREQASLRCSGFFFIYCLSRQVNVRSAHSAIPALGFLLSNRCCRCAGMVLQNRCHVANWVTFMEKALSTWSLRKYQGSEQNARMCALINSKCFDFNKRGYFLWLLCRLHPHRYSLWRGGSLERSGTK